MTGFANPINNGLLGVKTPGRTDRLPTKVAPNSYIVPADVVSGIGQGNSLAGGHILDNVFAHHLHSAFRHNLTPHDPIHPKNVGLGTGGKVKKMPVILAGGEYHVTPEIVRAIGKGNMAAGHKALDNMVKKVREHTIKTLKTLPKPK